MKRPMRMKVKLFLNLQRFYSIPIIEMHIVNNILHRIQMFCVERKNEMKSSESNFRKKDNY